MINEIPKCMSKALPGKKKTLHKTGLQTQANADIGLDPLTSSQTNKHTNTQTRSEAEPNHMLIKASVYCD